MLVKGGPMSTINVKHRMARVRERMRQRSSPVPEQEAVREVDPVKWVAGRNKKLKQFMDSCPILQRLVAQQALALAVLCVEQGIPFHQLRLGRLQIVQAGHAARYTIKDGRTGDRVRA